jgi:hypothetical protein
MGFSAMLAEEYNLIVPFAYQLQSGLNNKSQLYILTSTSVFQSASVPADESQNISTAESPEPLVAILNRHHNPIQIHRKL